MKTLIVLLFITMFALAGCVTTQIQCPSKDVIFFVDTPIGPMPVEIAKDYFNKDNEGKYYLSTKEYDKIMNEKELIMKDELKKQSDETVKEIDTESDKI